jgi:small conductance mechanosensitive channel
VAQENQPMQEPLETVAKWQDAVIAFLIKYGFQMLGAAIILVIGLFAARAVGRWFDRWLGKYRLEPPVRLLLVRACRLLIVALVLVMVLDQLGVQITPLIAGIGVAGVGIGLAMQGVLGNLMAGLTLIFTKPFRVGEYIELLGVYGQVTNIELFSTRLQHADKSIVTIPNRKIIGEILHNYGTMRQLDLNVGVAYGSDLPNVLATVREILDRNPRVLKDPAPLIGIETLGDSAINITVRPWVNVPDYVAAQLELYQAILEKFRAGGISIPFPQREVRLLGETPSR